jgi:hypothetical protein
MNAVHICMGYFTETERWYLNLEFKKGCALKISAMKRKMSKVFDSGSYE